MIEVKTGWVVNDKNGVFEFLKYIMSLGLVFHPDDNMMSYVNLDTDSPTFSVDDAKYLNGLILRCFDICGDEVYDICIEIMEMNTENVLSGN